MDAPEFVDMSDHSWEKWHGIEPDEENYTTHGLAAHVVTRTIVQVRGVPYSGDELPVTVVRTALPKGWRNLP